MSRITPCLAALLFVLTLRSSAPPAGHEGLDALLFVQRAAEWRALARQAYQAARDRLPALIDNAGEKAALEQSADHAAWSRPTAVIVDIDETVLDNSPYQARLILDGKRYDDASWDAWVEERRAAAVPGALAFLNEAASLGATVFYVSNRKAHLEEATRDNLRLLGFPLAAEPDCVMLRGEKEDWGKDKSSRRALIARDYRIVMLVGDDLGDFVPGARSDLAQRERILNELGERFGRSWFVLPNPCYGSWKDALDGAFPRSSGGEPTPDPLLSALDPRRD